MFDTGQELTLESFRLWLLVVFRLGGSFLSQNIALSRNLNHHWKCREQMKSFQTILVVIIWTFSLGFSTSSTRHRQAELDIYYKELCTQVASLVSERLKITEIRKCQNNLKFGWRRSLVPNLPSGNEPLVLEVKKYIKADVRVFYYFQISLLRLAFSVFSCSGVMVR